jgi:RNA polymerase sigma-70 factor (ECF subfamily)
VRKERETINADVDASELKPASTTASPYAALEQRDRVQLLRLALDKLAPSLKAAVMMRDIQELSYNEIAEQLRLPEGTVKSRINRGRTELARQIQLLRDQQDAGRRIGVTG